MKVYILLERGAWYDCIDDVVLGVYSDPTIPREFIEKLRREAMELSPMRASLVESKYVLIEQELK